MIKLFIGLFVSLIGLTQAQQNAVLEETKMSQTLVGSANEDSLSLSDFVSGIINTDGDVPLDVSKINKSYSTWVIFQNGCKTCHKMFKELKCLPSLKSTSHVVGVLSSPKELSEEVRRHSYKGPVYYSKAPLEKKLNLDVTPTIFVFKGESLISRIDNFASCAQLKSLMGS